MSRRNYGFIPGPGFNQPDKPSLSDVSPLGSTTPPKGKILLSEYLDRTLGYRCGPRDQGSTPSCVGQSTATGVDLLMGVSIAALGLKQSWRARASAESIYALSRVEIGAQKHGQKFRGGGSFVSYAAQAVKELGCLAQLDYPGYDLSEFNSDLCKEWGDSGLPDELELVSRHHVIKAFSAVTTADEAIAALACGFPVVIGCNQGFKGQTERDADGFLKPSGEWAHAQVFIGYDTLYSRPGIVCWNSWGTRWLRPDNDRNDIPDGSYFIDLDTAHSMIAHGDAVTMSQFSGFGDSKPLNFKLI